MKRIAVLDTAEWKHNTEDMSFPRMYSVFNDMSIRIAEIGHLPYSRNETCTTILAEKARFLAENARIRGTSDLHGSSLIQALHNKDFLSNIYKDTVPGKQHNETVIKAVEKWVDQDPAPDVDAICIAMRPSEIRNKIVKVTSKLGKKILLYPACFNNIEELQELRKQLGKEEAKVSLYSPRRYAAGVESAFERFHLMQPLASVSLELGSGGYPTARRWLIEFVAGFVDVLVNLGGTSDFEKIKLHASCVVLKGAPVISFTGICQQPNKPDILLPRIFNAVLSSHRSWQIGSHVEVNLTGNRHHLRISSDLAKAESYAQLHPMAETSDFSHDASHAVIFGGRPLLEEFFFELNPSARTPTLENYTMTQTVIDFCVDLVDLVEKSEGSEKCISVLSRTYCRRNGIWTY